MPIIDEDVLRRMRGETAQPKSSRSYYTTNARWAEISKTMKRLGARSLNKFLDEAVAIFLSVLSSETQEDRRDVERARATAAAEKPGAPKKYRGYYTANERWEAIEQAIQTYEFRNTNKFMDAAVDYFIAFVEQEMPKDWKPKSVPEETLRRLAGLPDTKKNGRK